MKLVVAVIQAYDSDRFLNAMTSAGFRATKIVSMGGFLRMANATILMGVEDDRVQDCFRIIRASCEPRAETPLDPHELVEWFPVGVHNVTVGGAVVFIIAVRDFVQMFPTRNEDVDVPD